jgi:predicted Ser/Thr protein kinase
MASLQCVQADVVLVLNCPGTVYCSRQLDICTIFHHESSSVFADLKNLKKALRIQAHDKYKSRLLHHLKILEIIALTFENFPILIEIDFAFLFFLSLSLKSLVQLFFAVG